MAKLEMNKVKRIGVPNPKFQAKWKKGYGVNPFYRTKMWRSTRQLVYTEEPFCRYCLYLHNRYTSTYAIDHIIPISQNGDKLDRDNLQGLCKKCHDKKTAYEANKLMDPQTQKVYHSGKQFDYYTYF